MTIIYLLVGVCLGIPLGWALLLLAIILGGKTSDPPTKEEWKVM